MRPPAAAAPSAAPAATLSSDAALAAIVVEAVPAEDDPNVASGAAPKLSGGEAFRRLWALRRTGDSLLVVIGLAMSTVGAFSNPGQAYAMTKLFFIFFAPNPDDVWFSTWFWSMNLFALCVLAVLAKSIEMACFGIVNAHLVKSLRAHCFTHLLKQEVGYFDKESNSAGELTEFLAEKVTDARSRPPHKVLPELLTPHFSLSLPVHHSPSHPVGACVCLSPRLLLWLYGRR